MNMRGALTGKERMIMGNERNYQQALAKLTNANQEHALKYYEELTEEQKKLLLAQIADTDFSVLASIKDKKGGAQRG